MQGIAITLLAIVFIVLSPVIIPVVALLHRAYRRRLAAVACTFACLSCGRMLGPDAAALADAEWEATRQQRQEDGPRLWRGGRRMVRDLDAICPSCGARYAYSDATRTLVRRGSIRRQVKHDPRKVDAGFRERIMLRIS
jgi:hypothetical protein